MSTNAVVANQMEVRIQTAGREVLQKIVDTPVEEYPCLHMIVDDIFPDGADGYSYEDGVFHFPVGEDETIVVDKHGRRIFKDAIMYWI